MAIDSKIIRIRRGTAADFNVGKTKLVQGEFAVVTDTKEAYFAAENGEAVRLATEKDVSQLEGQIGDLDGLTYGIYVGDTQPTNGVMYWLDTSEDSGSEEEPDTPIEPDEPENPEVTLQSISATYTGGEVVVGTALSSLTGIVVTATYSDGTTATVTDYTLSGTIAEGTNTITVSYGGLNATFTVTGVAKESDYSKYLDDESNIVANSENKNDVTTLTNANFMALTIEKLYVACYCTSTYNNRNMFVQSGYNSGYGVVKSNTGIGVLNTYNHISDEGFWVAEYDVKTVQTYVQGLYDDGTLDSTKPGVVSLKPASTAGIAGVKMLYNYVD